MKNTVLKSALVVFLCFFSIINFAQTKKEFVHGKVKSVIYIRMLEGKFADKTKYDYDDLQLLVKESDYNQTGDVPNFVLEYKYDQFRNLTETYKNGVLLETVDFSTDEKGKITRIVGLIYGKPNVTYYKYDKNGNEIESLFYTDDKLTSKRLHFYDAANNCVEIQFHINGKILIKNDKKYNPKNNVEEATNFIKDKLSSVYVYEYDDNDNEIKRIEYVGKKVKIRNTYTTVYKYDAEKNWTFKQRFQDDKPFLYIETRDFTYYP